MALFLFTFPINFRSRKVCSLLFFHPLDWCSESICRWQMQTSRTRDAINSNTEKSKENKLKSLQRIYLKSVDGWTKWWTSIWLLIKLFRFLFCFCCCCSMFLIFFFPDFFISKIKFWILRFRRINSIPRSVYDGLSTWLKWNISLCLVNIVVSVFFFFLCLRCAMVESNSLGDDAVLMSSSPSEFYCRCKLTAQTNSPPAEIAEKK